MKKIIALILAICCTLPLIACGGSAGGGGGDGGNEKFNVRGKNKTTINFESYAGGIGGEWVDIVCEEFAKRNAKTSFGTGKEGVYIEVTPKMPTNLSGLANTNVHIITSCSSETPNVLANSGEFYNLNAIVRDTKRVGGTIESILFESVISSLKGNDGNYYGLPHFEYYHGMQYNRNVFHEQKALFAEPNTAVDPNTVVYSSPRFSSRQYKFTNNNGNLTKGPDGIPRTEDDGLPASMEELLVLMDYFKNRTIYNPIVASADCINYTDTIVAGLWAALAGQQQMQNYFNSTGDIEVVKRDSVGNIIFTSQNLYPGISYIKKPETETVTLNASNGYLGRDMVSRFYAYAFLEIAQKESWFSPEAFTPGINNYDAQLALLVGSRLPKYSNSAILCEYSYWYNETKNGGSFNKAKLTGLEESDFDTRFMCLPTSLYYNETQPEKPASIAVANDAYLFVNANISNNADVEAAVKEFVKFLYSDEMLKKVTVLSGFTRPLRYQLETDDLAAMSGYTKRLWELRKNDGSNVIYNSGNTVAHKLNKSALRLANTFKGGANNAWVGIKNNGSVSYFNSTTLKESSWHVNG